MPCTEPGSWCIPSYLIFPCFQLYLKKKKNPENPLIIFYSKASCAPPAVCHWPLCWAGQIYCSKCSATNGKSDIMAMYIFFFQWTAVASSHPNENLYEPGALEVHHGKQIVLLTWGQLPLTVQRGDDSCRTFSPFASGWEKMQNDQFKRSSFESLVKSFIIIFCLICSLVLRITMCDYVPHLL